ncbi:MAG: RNA methyltransferase [Caldilineaceae bacterium]|nr:RNA methyltransferase [Caldilineaceae bacterium]
MRITSLQNDRIKAAIKLQKARERSRQQQTLVEGYRSLLAAVENGYPLQEVYACPELYLGQNEADLLARAAVAGAEIVEVAEAPFRKLSARDRPDGLLAIAPQARRELDSFTPGETCLLLIAEAVEKPANLGMILRSADAAGADALIVCNRVADVYHPEVIRASVGTFFSMPIYDVASEQALDWCRRHRVHTLAATPFAEQTYTDAQMNGRIALAVGAEQYGLSKLWMEQADDQVRLPMLGQADSLNVAMAATILLYEALRQRQVWTEQ